MENELTPCTEKNLNLCVLVSWCFKDYLFHHKDTKTPAIALDTVRNEYILHRQIHQWFVQGNQTSNLDALNEKVYAELFLNPSSDPWLGLAPDDVYSAIDNDGVK